MELRTENNLTHSSGFNPALWGVIGYLFLKIFRPFEYWVWLGDLRIERIYMILLIILVAVWPGKKYFHHTITVLLLIFLAVMCFSAMFAYRPDKAWDQVWEYFKLIIFYFVLILSVRDKRDFKILVIAFLVVTGIYVGKSLWEFLLHGRHVYRMGIRRLIGIDQTYSDPNTFAATIVYSLPFVWALLKIKPPKWLKLGLLAYGAMAVVSIGFTGSRSGMLSFILFLLLIWMQGRKKFIGVIAVVVFLITAWILLPKEYKMRFETIFDDTINPIATQSADSRIEHVKMGIKLFKMRPFAGWGPGNAPYISHDICGAEQEIQLHNLEAQTMAELGLLGILSFSAFIFMLFYTKRKTQQILNISETKDDFLEQISIACTNTVILLLFDGLFGHNLYRYTWLWLAAVTVLSYRFAIIDVVVENAAKEKEEAEVQLQKT